MSIKHDLSQLFNPKNVAILGASEREGSVGRKVMSNMLKSDFPGGIYPVNPKHHSVMNNPCVPSVKDIKAEVDLAVITTPAASVPAILEECGEKGIQNAIIISAGFSEMGAPGKELERKVLATAEKYHIKFIGPNCLGVMRPESKLNATFDNNNALPGSVALISQSGAICASVLDWAIEQNIGFSTIVSMGNSIDLDFGDMLEYLAHDSLTKSILLYIEGIHYSKRFIHGLRAASKLKPVVALKAGRNSSGVRAVHSHTGALVGDDDVFTAALARGGAVRVHDIDELFIAAEVLSSRYRAKGNRLTIVTNGGGAGVMAADRATELNLTLPALSKTMLAKLNPKLPPQWSHQNPLDIIGDATPERYRHTVEICLDDKDSDALLTILVPIAMTKPHEVAQEISQFAQRNHKPLLTCWMGEKQVKTSRQLFAENNIPSYATPEMAVTAFSFLAAHHANQELLAQEAEPALGINRKAVKAAETIIHAAMAEGRKILTTQESKDLLSAFGIPVSPIQEVHSVEEAVSTATQLGFPVVMKISSPDITHKQDVGGVLLNIKDAASAKVAYEKIQENVKQAQPQARISGITVEKMLVDAHYRELMIGITHDKVFGPVIAFGMGGSLVEIIKDKAVALPPLNSFLAKQLIAETKASKMLDEFRGKPPVNLDALIQILIQVSDLACELPQILEMDINPLLVNEKEAIVVDARFVIADKTVEKPYDHIVLVKQQGQV